MTMTEQLDKQQRQRLVKALEKCSCMKAHESRMTILQELGSEISTKVRDVSQPRMHIYHIVRACQDHPDGLKNLMEAVQFFEENSLPMQNLSKIFFSINTKSRLIRETARSAPLISPFELSSLKDILRGITMKDKDVYDLFKRFAFDSPEQPAEYDDNILLGSVEILAKRSVQTAEWTPLFEFLDQLNAYDKSVLMRLDGWIRDVARRLNIDPTEIQAVREKTRQSQALKTGELSSVLVEIVPTKKPERKHEFQIDEEEFTFRIWNYENNSWLPQRTPEHAYFRQALENEVPGFIEKAFTQLGSNTQNFLIEFSLPLSWFDWNVNRIPCGPEKENLGSVHPVVIRSRDRVHNKQYPIVGHRLEEKWAICPGKGKRLSENSIYCLFDSAGCMDKLFRELKKMKNILFFIAMVDSAADNKSETLQKIFTPALTAGLPFALWSLHPHKDSWRFCNTVKKVVCLCDIDQLPRKLKKLREEEESQTMQNQIWSNMLILWDNPERRPPNDSVHEDDEKSGEYL